MHADKAAIIINDDELACQVHPANGFTDPSKRRQPVNRGARLTDCGVIARRSRWPHWSIRRKTGPASIFASSSQCRSAVTGRPISTTCSSSSDVVVLVRPRWIVRQGSARRWDWCEQVPRPPGPQHVVPQPRNGVCRQMRKQQQRPIAQVDQPIARASRKQFGKNVTGDSLLAFSLTRAIAGTNRQAKRTFQRRRRKRSGQPAPARQDRPARQPAANGRR